MLFSIFDTSNNNYQKNFELQSNEQEIYPNQTSSESFQGRKCYEFEWNNEDESFGVGFVAKENIQYQTSFFFAGHSLETPDNNFHIQYLSRNTNKKNSTNLSIRFEKDKRYMICIDTISYQIMLIYNTEYVNSFVFSLPYPKTNKWNVFVECSVPERSIDITSYFHYNFVNSIPKGFFSLVDPRNIELITCGTQLINRISSYFLLNCIFLGS